MIRRNEGDVWQIDTNSEKDLWTQEDWINEMKNVGLELDDSFECARSEEVTFDLGIKEEGDARGAAYGEAGVGVLF
jgi:hypothetical protein